MVAQVYPMMRMPRKTRVFDYLIPPDVPVARGHMVEIPFRNKRIYGIVARVKEEQPRAIQLKTILRTLPITLSENELAFFESVAEQLIQSVPSLLHASLPTPPRRKSPPKTTVFEPLTLKANEADDLADLIGTVDARNTTHVRVGDIKRMTSIVAGLLHLHPKRPTLVLLPNVEDAKRVHAHLGPFSPALITGEESNNERFQAWMAFRRGDSGVLVGTRIASLLPHPSLETIFVLRSSHDNHKQADRNPRYDARTIAEQLSQRLGAKRILLDASLRVEDLASINIANRLIYPHQAKTRVVSLGKERPTAPHASLGNTSAQMIEACLAQEKRVLLVLNRKGLAQSLKCDACGHFFRCDACQTPLRAYERALKCHRCNSVVLIPRACPSCQSTRLKPRGIGNAQLSKDVSTLFSVKAGICDAEHPEMPLTPIVIGTNHVLESAFDPFHPERFGAVILIDADTSLSDPTFRAVEKTMEQMTSWQGLAFAAGADLLIQTDAPELFERYLFDQVAETEKELQLRERFGQPPFTRFFQITYRSDEPKEVEHSLQVLKQEITATLPKATCFGPRQKTASFRLDVSLPPADVPALARRFSILPDAYIIDSDPVF